MSVTTTERTPKPDFFLVGAPKCGTSSMTTYLMRHPEVFMSRTWDPHFFGTDLYSPWWVRDEDTYRGLFSEARDEKRVGESSVWYLYSQRAAAEMRAYCGSARIIAMLRNPVEAVHALHNELYYHGREDIADFATAIAAEDDRKQGRRIPATATTPSTLHYREVVKFAGQLQRYFDQFGRENVHVIIYDDLKQDTAAVYRDVCTFLGVDPTFDAGFEIVNRNKRLRSAALRELEKRPPRWLRSAVTTVLAKPVRRKLKAQLQQLHTSREPRRPIPSEMRDRLRADFAPEVDKLSALLGRDLSHWNRA